MVSDMADAIAAAPKKQRRKLRPGSYLRSNVLSGYGNPGAAVIDANTTFGVSIAAEYADRIEAQPHGDKSSFSDYEYLKSAAVILRYNPDAVTLDTGQGIAGSMTICDPSTGGCTGPDFTNTGIEISVASQGTGWVQTTFSIVNQLFSYLNSGILYYTLWSGYGYTYYPAEFPGMMGHFGLARVPAPTGYIYYASEIIHEGVDVDIDLPLSLYYFSTNAGASGLGSEFWIDVYSRFTNFSWSWTNGTLTPSGFITAAGSDDDSSYSLTKGGVVNGGEPDSCNRIIHNGNERTNTAIAQSGEVAPGYEAGCYGGYQQWPARLCVQ